MNPTVTYFPVLYKRKSSGKLQQWEIWVSGNEMHVRYGEVGGKLQYNVETIALGKNRGRANETTPEAQAEFEAQAKWEKQLNKGYVQEVARAEKAETNLEGVSPMLAHKYSEHGDKIRFPAAVQPKLDGIRCLTRADGTLWSRTQKPITGVPHIENFLFEHWPKSSPLFDGELYNHAFKNNFEHIVSIVRQTKKVDPNHQDVEYHVYDLAIQGLVFAERWGILNAVEEAGGPIRIVPTYLVNNEEELMEYFERFRAEGYEGAMVRNLDAPYEQKRSYNLQKVKEFDDAEFDIVGVQEGRGKMAGHAVFTCRTEAGSEFEVKLKGKLTELSKYLSDESLWRGKKLSVQYQGFTGRNKVPRFPVGLSVRDYE